MRGEYQTRQKREMTRFLSEHAMQSFTPEELARDMEAEGVHVGQTTAYRFLESLCRQQTARRYQDARGLRAMEEGQCLKRCSPIFNIRSCSAPSSSARW